MEYLPYLLFAIGCVVSVLCYMIIIMGKIINDMKTPKSGGAPWFSKPDIATKIASVIIMGLFLLGSYFLIFLVSNKIMMIIGISLIVTSGLAIITSVIFCGVVINAIKANGKRING